MPKSEYPKEWFIYNTKTKERIGDNYTDLEKAMKKADALTGDGRPIYSVRGIWSTGPQLPDEPIGKAKGGMANVPLPPETPSWRKKKVKPEDMPMSEAMQEYLSKKTTEESEDRIRNEAVDEAKEEYKIRGYKNGGMVKVRGAGIAARGKGKGRMC